MVRSSSFILSLILMVLVLAIAWTMSGTRLALAANLQSPFEQANTVQVTVTRPSVNLRSGPGTTFAVAGSAKQGQKFVAKGRNAVGDWYNITLEDGKEAWISASLVQVQGDATSLATVQAQASSPATAASASVHTGELSGRLLYSTANMDAKRWELWEYNFANGENKKVADWRTELDVSADGKQIAYFAWPPQAGEKTGIWIMDADFSNARLVVRGGAYPSFSPGGDRLVANGGDVLYVLKTDGNDIRGLTKGEYPAWSPVSNEIVHRACVGGSCGLWIINADSKDAGARRHITTGGSDGQPAWSPDGKRIAYISKDDGNFEIYVIGSDGSNKVRLTSNPASDGLPVWSPDGRWIAFRSDRDGKWAIYVAQADGSNVRKVVDADVLPLWFFEKMDWRR